MKPYHEHNGQTIYKGHVMDILPQLPPESVHCVISSPPYWGLRDYNIEPQVWDDPGDCQHEWGDNLSKVGKVSHGKGGSTLTGGHESWGNRDGASQGQFCRHCNAWLGSLGLEPTPELYVQHIVQVFRGVWRVLRKDGVIFLNLGDSYASGGGGFNKQDAKHFDYQKNTRRAPTPPGLKPKDLCMMPARVALALQADGWWLRQQIIWAKGISFCDSYSGSVMPESVRDRFCNSYEVVYLLSKSAKYFFDLEAVREPIISKPHGRGGDPNGETVSTYHTPGIISRDTKRNWGTQSGRTPRSVWAINPQPFKAAHFATMPEKLVQKCILSGTSAKGVCSECGAPHVRVVESKPATSKECPKTQAAHEARGGIGIPIGTVGKSGSGRIEGYTQTLGWQPSCSCNADTVPAVVLDPFLGSGTVLKVAKQLGRHGIGAELNPEYCEMAVDRIGAQEMLPFNE